MCSQLRSIDILIDLQPFGLNLKRDFSNPSLGTSAFANPMGSYSLSIAGSKSVFAHMFLPDTMTITAL